MAAFTLKSPEVFPTGTVVKAYLVSNWPTPEGRDNPTGAPLGSVAAEGTVSAGAVTLTGLTQDVAYWVTAEVGGVRRYLKIIGGADSTKTGKREDFANQTSEEVASAATITVSRLATRIRVTGITEIKKINPTKDGHLIVLSWASTAKLVKGENLKIPATIEPTADDCVTLICDGTNWYQVAPLQAN